MEEKDFFDFSLEPGKNLDENRIFSFDKPLISIVTVCYNSKDYIMQTANSILNQTFPYWEWIIVNDGSTQEELLEKFDYLVSLDKRIKVINQKNMGLSKSRDNGIKEASCDLIFVIDSDDCVDKTLLECAYFTMLTNKDAMWAYCDNATFDGKQFLWKKHFDCETEKQENILPVCSLIRKQAIIDVGGYSIADKDVYEDWHLWLRMLEKRMYPVHMNYYGFWYRVKKEGGLLSQIKDDENRKEHADEIISELASKIQKNVAAIEYPVSTYYDYNEQPYTFDWDKKPIFDKSKENILFIFPWMKVGGADKFNYDLISRMDQNKYRITIITTEPSDYIWRQKFEKYATIFDLTTFLHRQHWVAFIDYIIKSRNIDLVMNSNSYYGFNAIPWLKAKNEDVIFTDYLHALNFDWRNGEYPADSTAICKFLDLTFVSNNQIKEVMKNQMERKEDNVEVAYIGVDSKIFDRDNKDIFIPDEIKKYQDKDIILYCCRVSKEKRPFKALDIFNKYLAINKNAYFVVVGDGVLLEDMKQYAKKLNIENNVYFAGNQDDVRPFYKLSKLLLICSEREGITITSYEALSMGIPVVSANIGGQKELIDENCGILIDTCDDEKIENESYAKAIDKIISSKDYNKYRNDCRQRIIENFDINNTMSNIYKKFDELIKNGTDKKGFDNINLYSRFLVLYNELDRRTYNQPIGGEIKKYICSEQDRIDLEISKYQKVASDEIKNLYNEIENRDNEIKSIKNSKSYIIYNKFKRIIKRK